MSVLVSYRGSPSSIANRNTSHTHSQFTASSSQHISKHPHLPGNRLPSKHSTLAVSRPSCLTPAAMNDVSFDDEALLRSMGKSRRTTTTTTNHLQPQASTLANRRGPSATGRSASSSSNAQYTQSIRMPDWGPAIPSDVPSKPHRKTNATKRSTVVSTYSDDDGLFNSSPGVGRAHHHHDRSSPLRRLTTASSSKAGATQSHPLRSQTHQRHSSSSSSSDEEEQEEEEESPFRPLPMHSRESTGNHRALAASSTAGWTQRGYPQPQRKIRSSTLGPDALRKLDRFAAAASASESESSSHKKHSQAAAGRSGKDSCEPTYTYAQGPGRTPVQAHLAHLPTSPSPAPTGRVNYNPPPPPPGISKNALATLANQLRDELNAVEGDRDTMQAQTSKSNHDSSAETLVDSPLTQNDAHSKRQYHHQGMNARGYTKILPSRVEEQNRLLLPSGVEMGKAPISSVALPDDLTGLTAALESPQKTRLGVRHATLHPCVGQLNLDERKTKIAELHAFITGIEEELNTTKDRLDGVETREEELRGDVRKLREERLPQPQSSYSADHHAEKEFAAKLNSMSEHITALHAEFNGYRAVFEEIRGGSATDGKGSKPTAHRDDRTVSSRHQSRTHEEEDAEEEEYMEEYSPEYLELKADIKRVEKQISQIRVIVENSGADADQGSETRQTRIPSRRVRMASDTIATHPVQPPFGRRRVSSRGAQQGDPEPRSDEIDDTVVLDFDVRSSTLPASKVRGSSSKKTRVEDVPDKCHSQFEDELTMADARVDRTMRNVIKHHNKDKGQSRSRTRSGEQATKSQSQGADDVSRDVSLGDLSHDATKCTVCASSRDRQDRRSHRRARVLASVQRHGSVEEDLLLSLLSGSNATSPIEALQSLLTNTTSSQSITTLSTLLKTNLRTQLDEFYHAKLLYSELADELKTLDPLSSSWTAKRRQILMEHVLERVEELEVRCEKIDTVRGLIEVVEQTTSGKRRGVESKKDR
ncbi:unnamed protein product [Sympodiomycopsis kandeliae]